MKATLLPPAFSCTKRRPSWRDQVLSKSKIAVLVVEDIPQIRAIAIQLFEELGCRVFDAYNGQQALKLLQAHPDIQVLFADVRMPGMSGTELAAAAQHLRPALRIVLTSGYVTQRDVPSDIPFVPKPWRMQDIAAIAAVVGRSGQGRPEGDEG
jgi:CheY-like chemotaxis protein